MVSLFSSTEESTLTRTVEVENGFSSKTSYGTYWSGIQLETCVKWIQTNDYKVICLQFPDSILTDSVKIADEISSESGRQVFILGDTSYGSCCVDEIAAAHVSADAVIHFGPACLSKLSGLPVHYIFPQYAVDLDALSSYLEKRDGNAFVFYDVGYYHAIDTLKSKLAQKNTITFGELAINAKPDIFCWKFNDEPPANDAVCIYIGDDNQSFFNISMAIIASKWIILNAVTGTATESSPLASTWMRRRYFYIEKCKDARALGIVVATLTSDNFLEIVNHIQSLARKRGIRTYIISVGKINPAKLANFADIDCFVLVGCPENHLYTSREFHKPLVSIFEVEVALNPAWSEQLPENYCNDFKQFLPGGKMHHEFDDVVSNELDVSLITGRIRGRQENEDDSKDSNNSSAIVRRTNYDIMESNGGTVNGSTWHGLEPARGLNEPAILETGRSGLPIKYEENPQTNE